MKKSERIRRRCAATRGASRRQSGVTLIETMIAAFVLIVGVLAIMGTFAVATTQNWNQGDRATRTTEYAQDKMEQLMALQFGDTGTDTTVYPPTAVGGTGLTPGGSVAAGAPVAGYVDYLDNAGTQQTTATVARYIRQWSIAINGPANLKTITVVTRALSSLGGGAAAPGSTLVCTKSLIQ